MLYCIWPEPWGGEHVLPVEVREQIEGWWWHSIRRVGTWCSARWSRPAGATESRPLQCQWSRGLPPQTPRRPMSMVPASQLAARQSMPPRRRVPGPAGSLPSTVGQQIANPISELAQAGVGPTNAYNRVGHGAPQGQSAHPAAPLSYPAPGAAPMGFGLQRACISLLSWLACRSTLQANLERPGIRPAG